MRTWGTAVVWRAGSAWPVCAIDHSEERPQARKLDAKGLVLHVFHLDYLSCALTVLSTVLVARKMWTGLVVAGINSVLICVIGLKTSQFGLIPANLFCIAVYIGSLRSWVRPGPQTR